MSFSKIYDTNEEGARSPSKSLDCFDSAVTQHKSPSLSLCVLCPHCLSTWEIFTFFSPIVFSSLAIFSFLHKPSNIEEDDNC